MNHHYQLLEPIKKQIEKEMSKNPLNKKMILSKRLKEEILVLFKDFSLTYLGKQLDISISTLRVWKKRALNSEKVKKESQNNLVLYEINPASIKKTSTLPSRQQIPPLKRNEIVVKVSEGKELKVPEDSIWAREVVKFFLTGK